MKLRDYQEKAVNELKNGSVLCGGVGSGKSITAIAYYYTKICKNMTEPRDLYIITTAKKRESKEWEKELTPWHISKDRHLSICGVRVVIDSWNNMKKYSDVYGAFFIFDEQRVVGRGAWVKAFLKISRKNQWILLSATPGDQWSDYVPVFIANGFFRNRTEFNNLHCVFSPYTKFPKIEKYIGERRLRQLRDSILVYMKDDRNTVRHNEYVKVDYDTSLYRTVMRDRWNPYDNEPIQETGKLMYLIRRVVNSDFTRIMALDKILREKKYLIVFYNFDYELEIIKDYLENIKHYKYAEWNGHKHEEIPVCKKGWVYLVQYSAGCEGWNCITTDTIVFFSQTYSYRMLEQASGRIDRINTPFRDLYYYHLRSDSSIDLAIWSKLKNKQTFNEQSFIRKMR